MIELTLQAGGRIAVAIREVAAVLENSDGCLIVLKSGCTVDVVDRYDQIGTEAAWDLQ